jgi:hypothetical protein
MAVRAATTLLMVLVGGMAFAQSEGTLLDTFRAQLEMEKRLLAADLGNLERLQEQLRSATDRLLRLNEDLLRAEREGEDMSGFSARSTDLRKAESEVEELTRASQQLRSTMAARRGTVDQLQAEVKKLEESGAGEHDDLSGRWIIAIEPGGMKGNFDLQLDGTLVTGVYQLAGGWKGSLRGTLISGNVRLERIDSQLGLAAIYTARLVTRDGEVRLEGRWESTNLAAGMAQSGTWVGQREKER